MVILSLLKHRLVVATAGLGLLIVLIWLVGPIIAIADRKPLEPLLNRVVAIALVVLGFVIWEILKRVRARQASDKLAAALVAQAQSDDRPNAEVVRLRERFEEAVATIRESAGRGGHGLYDLPWYVFIGAPGSGKTTALVNSGLRFPLEARGGRAALQGVGGTRNCDWWFTDEAVFLDTAGRYTTQDSDAAADSAAWREFLALLRTHRGRRPLNGIILTVSAADLLTQSAEARETYVEAARRRLQEIARELRMQLPVYLMVTKSDLVAGFTEYFDDLTREGREQVWGVTFAYEDTNAGAAARRLPEEFDRLLQRLNERLLVRVADERDVRRRARLFAFPQQMLALRAPLTQFAEEVFAASRFETPILLRGVYFTSGTQEGTPIDRLLGALGRRFAVADAVAQPAGRGKAYFIERLLRNVVFAESGLAGVNRRTELRNAAVQLGVYAALGIVAVAAVVLLLVSYGRNRAYLDAVAAETSMLADARPVSPSSPREAVLARLDALRSAVDVAERHRDGAPLTMRWGLFQGRSVGNAARDAYVSELNRLLMPRLVADMERQLNGFAAPEVIYDYLKAYLILGGRAPEVEPSFLRLMAREGGGGDPRLTAHIESLLADRSRLRAVGLNDTLVRQAQQTIASVRIPVLVYRTVQREYDERAPGAIVLEERVGLDSARVLRRRSGIALSTPLPALYTRDAFAAVTGTNRVTDLAAEYAAESWVWGDTTAPPSSGEIRAEVLQLYEADYIRFWDELIEDVTIAPLSGGDLATELGILGGAGAPSPLRLFYETVREHTLLVEPDAPAGGDAEGAAPIERPSGFGRGAAAGVAEVPPEQAARRRITARFAQYHALVGPPGAMAPIDRVLGDVREMQQIVAKTGTRLGQAPATAETRVQMQQAVRTLNDGSTALPPPVRALVRQVADVADNAVAGGARSQILTRYQQVVAECRQVIDRYPLVPHAQQDLPVQNFVQLFGPNGVFEAFTREFGEFIDATPRTWTWRRGAGLAIPNTLPEQLQRARSIRDNFFPVGAEPQFAFELFPLEKDPEVRTFRIEAGGDVLLEWRGETLRKPLAVRAALADSDVVATFADGSAPEPHVQRDGPWAWFRVFEAGRLQRLRAERYALVLTAGGRQVELQIDMPGTRNPLEAWPLLRQFPCDAS